MTITQSPSAPLVVVVGATGIQGGSVVRELAASDRIYRIRRLTRDSAKPASRALADIGVDVVAVTLSVGNEVQVQEAFRGADIAFIVTNFWEHMDKQREIAEGKMLVDAAATAGAGLVLWSGLDDVTAASGGKYPHVDHFDSKATVTVHGRAHAGVRRFVDVQAGCYASNFVGLVAPRKREDGVYVLRLPVDAHKTMLPVIDMVHDYGLFVRAAIEVPETGSEILSCGELISLEDIVAQLSEITGKKVVYEHVSDETFKAFFGGFPEPVRQEVLESQKSVEEFGYYGRRDVGPSQQHLARKPRTWGEYVKATDWSTVLV